jgi:four helix bundle protein
MTRHEELKRRAAEFARDIAHFTRPLLRSSETEHTAKQLRRSATAVAANYRAAGLARTDIEFAAKIGVVREEADECRYWLEYLKETVGAHRRELTLEAAELRNIFAASYATAKRNLVEKQARKAQDKRR